MWGSVSVTQPAATHEEVIDQECFLCFHDLLVLWFIILVVILSLFCVNLCTFRLPSCLCLLLCVCVQVCQSLSLISLFCAHVLFFVCVIPCFPSMFISLDLLISPSVVSSQSPCHVMVYCLPLCHVSLPSSLLSAFPPLLRDIRQFPVLF